MDLLGKVVSVAGRCVPFEAGKRTLVRQYVTRALARQGSGRERVQVRREGLDFDLRLDREIDLWIYLTGWWEKTDCRIALRALQPGATVLDIGANIGSFALRAAQVVGRSGRVIAFEPDVRSRDELTCNIERNTFENIFVEPLALGRASGEREFHLASTTHPGDSSLFPRIDRGGAGSERVIRVAVDRLDDYVERQNLTRIDFIKIDVEGGEPDVLAGARETLRRFRPQLLVECNPEMLAAAGSSAAHLVDELVTLEYRLFHRGHWGTQLLPLNAVPDSELTDLHCIPISDTA